MLAAVMCAAGEGMADDGRRSPSASVDWGIYQIYWTSPKYLPILKGEIAKLASSPDYVMFYRDLSCPFPKVGVDAAYAVGAVPIISLELWKWHDSTTKQLPRIVAGAFDDHFRKWAEQAKRDGRRVLLRFGFEFNGNWFSWAGDPKAFVRAWRRVRAIFDDVGASNVEWVWCANVTSHPADPANDMQHYYPGDAAVEWLAVDGYNWGDHYRSWHHWQSFDELFGKVLKRFAEQHPTKPVMITEVGCPEGKPGQKGAWIRDAYASALRWPQLKAMIWFNFDKRREGELNFRIDTSRQALKAFNETFAAPRQPPSDP